MGSILVTFGLRCIAENWKIKIKCYLGNLQHVFCNSAWLKWLFNHKENQNLALASHAISVGLQRLCGISGPIYARLSMQKSRLEDFKLV